MKPTYLLFDTSAAGKPKDWKAPFSDTFAWPRLVHISWIVLDKDFKPLHDFDYVVETNPEWDKKIKKSCKIDNDDVERKSIPLNDILNFFEESVKTVDYLISFNLNFNENVVAAEFIRENLTPSIFAKERFCLMQESTFYCKIPSRTGGYKWPSLTELHAILFKSRFSPPNNARADVIAAARCFILLMKVKALDDMFDEEEE